MKTQQGIDETVERAVEALKIRRERDVAQESARTAARRQRKPLAPAGAAGRGGLSPSEEPARQGPAGSLATGSVERARARGQRNRRRREGAVPAPRRRRAADGAPAPAAGGRGRQAAAVEGVHVPTAATLDGCLGDQAETPPGATRSTAATPSASRASSSMASGRGRRRLGSPPRK